MKVAIIGSGIVGQTLGKKLVELGYELLGSWAMFRTILKLWLPKFYPVPRIGARATIDRF